MRSGHKKGKAARWRASDTLMQMIEEELKSSNTATTPSPFSIRVLEAIAEAKRKRPDRSGCDPCRYGKRQGNKRRPTTSAEKGAQDEWHLNFCNCFVVHGL